jgi:tyrosyl-tRNA synthetase
MNLADADCGKFLRIFTFLSKEEVEDIERRHAADAAQRLAQRTIARAMVAMLHGEYEADAAEATTRALFSGEIASLSEASLTEMLAEAPASTHPRARLEGDGVDLVELLVQTALATSKKQAREFLAAGAVTINGQPAPGDHRLRPTHLLHASMIAMRRGKKNWHLTRWE